MNFCIFHELLCTQKKISQRYVKGGEHCLKLELE